MAPDPSGGHLIFVNGPSLIPFWIHCDQTEANSKGLALLAFLPHLRLFLCHTLSFTALWSLCFHLGIWWGKARNASAMTINMTHPPTYLFSGAVSRNFLKKKKIPLKMFCFLEVSEILFHLSYEPHYGVNSSLFTPATTSSTSEMRSLIV